MFQLIIIVVLTIVSCTTGENPAFQVTLNNKGLQYGKHVAAGWIQDRLGLITLPDISGEALLVHYTLSGIKITKCDFPEPSVEFYQNVTGLKSSITGLSIAVNGSWATHLGVIHDGGTFDLAVFNVGVTSVVKLGKDSNGHLSVTNVNCDAKVGDVQMNFYGGQSWIFKPFLKYYKGHVLAAIQANICPNVEDFIVKVESHLQALNVSIIVDSFLSLDLNLTSSPVIDSTSLNLPLKGQFYSIKTHKEPPFVAQPFTMPKQTDYMLSIGLSDFTANSASYAYYSDGQLMMYIDDKMIPPASPVHLNTSSMGPYIPQLPQMFPNLLMKLLVYARNCPMFSFQPGAVKLGLPLAIKAFAIQPNTSLTPLFKLHVVRVFSPKCFFTFVPYKKSIKAHAVFTQADNYSSRCLGKINSGRRMDFNFITAVKI
uniref:Bactericidal permeability-increasing protein n=1 Tax=Sphaeramia orbicularis TaxID=375764 RepID=A0A673ABI0_9TELE